MITKLLLLDLSPGPPSPGVGMGELIFVAIVVLMLTAAAVAGFVFLLRRLLRSKHQVAQTSVPPEFQPNSPNQP